jgi:hypothetical protein
MSDQPGKAAHEILHPGILRRILSFEAACVSGRIVQDLQPAFQQNVFWQRHVGFPSSQLNAHLRIEFRQWNN